MAGEGEGETWERERREGRGEGRARESEERGGERAERSRERLGDYGRVASKVGVSSKDFSTIALG
eukprot:594672-Amorphochlora_amoeboformis.AAC.1